MTDTDDKNQSYKRSVQKTIKIPRTFKVQKRNIYLLRKLWNYYSFFLRIWKQTSFGRENYEKIKGK